jgi:hypothetical protein
VEIAPHLGNRVQRYVHSGQAGHPPSVPFVAEPFLLAQRQLQVRDALVGACFFFGQFVQLTSDVDVDVDGG